MMKAKRVFEFHKGEDALTSLGVGPVEQINLAKKTKEVLGAVKTLSERWFNDDKWEVEEYGNDKTWFEVSMSRTVYFLYSDGLRQPSSIYDYRIGWSKEAKYSCSYLYEDCHPSYSTVSRYYDQIDTIEEAINILNEWFEDPPQYDE